jgi:hypothetical protein
VQGWPSFRHLRCRLCRGEIAPITRRKSHGRLGKGRTAGAGLFFAEVMAGPQAGARCAFVNGRNKIDALFLTYAETLGPALS